MAYEIYQGLQLYSTGDKFYIESGNEQGECLVIDRLAQYEIRIEQRTQIPLGADRKTIYGLIGTIRLLAGPHLLVITEAESIGQITGHTIYYVKKFEVIPYNRTTLHLTERQVEANRIMVGMVYAVLNTPGFYFSYTLDLTYSLQRLQNTDPDFKTLPMHERANQRFLWNKHVLYEFTLVPEAHRFALPLMHGFVGIRHVTMGDRKFSISLISRRSWMRAGTRFHTRGIDSHGNAANFVETEQIVHYENYVYSHVQFRGSIPLLWSQKPNLKWQPMPNLRGEDQQTGFNAHINDCLFQYPGELVLMNLINSKGREKGMGEAFRGVWQSSGIPNTRYEYFDFHKECKGQWNEGMLRLEARLAPYIKEHQYFASTLDGALEPVTQKGYVRTNCMDCLDRTNVVQALVARHSLTHQLRSLAILSEAEDGSGYSEFEYVFKNLWADNGDACSVQYAGTGALKTDFTRYGTRTYVGACNDLANALTRYVKNNFSDGERQDALDLFVGNYVVDELRDDGNVVGGGVEEWRDWRGVVILFTIFAVAMIILTFLLATEHAFSFIFFWLVLLGILLAIISLNGDEFVNKPKLKQD